VTNLSYYPLASRGRPSTIVDNPVECQSECKNMSWCAHFVYNTLTKSCDLQDDESTTLPSAVYQISGPPDCRPTVEFDAVVDGHGEEELLHNVTVVRNFLQLTKVAIVMYVGTYVPYDNGVAGEPEKLLSVDDIELKVNGSSSGEGLQMKVSIHLDTQKALYARALFNKSDVTRKLDDQVEAFLRTKVADHIDVNGSSHSLRHMRLELTNITSPRIVSAAGDFIQDQYDSFSEGNPSTIKTA